MKNKLNKRTIYICMALSILLISASIILPRPLNNLDEIWNYNFANCITKGLIPYKDFNMLQMPLTPMIEAIFLKIFGNEMIVTRILEIFLITGIGILIIKIIEKLTDRVILGYISAISLIYVIKDYIAIDYNFMVLLFTLIITIQELKNKDDLLNFNWKKDLILGIIAGLAIISKQSTGIILGITLIGYKILLVRNKKEFIEFLKKGVINFLGMLIPVAIMMIYIISNNALNDFIDYTILGIKTFSNKISYISLIKESKIFFRIMSLLAPIILITSIIYGTIKKDREMLILASFGISLIAVTFPISDVVHFSIGMIISVILIIYLIFKSVYKLKIKEPIKIFGLTFLKVYCTLSAIFLTYISIPNIITYAKDASKYKELNHFKYIQVSETFTNQIKKVQNYILENDNVYILDAEAALYMIPIDRYNKNYDMFLKGNIGSRGEEGQIQELKSKDNKTILIKNENYGRNWQNPEKVREYIIKNMEKQGEILFFDIYN